MLKKWWLVDDCMGAKSQIFEKELSNDKEMAIRLATAEWNRLSQRDQKIMGAFYIGYAASDEDGCVDYNTMTEIVNIK